MSCAWPCPGVQVLFAFLLVVPFNQRFAELSPGQERLYLFTLLTAGVASALLIAPTAHHRITFREQEKEYIVRMGNRLTVAGLGVPRTLDDRGDRAGGGRGVQHDHRHREQRAHRPAVRRVLVRAAARAPGAARVSSLWTDGAPELHAPPLEHDAAFDVAVLGAGITGVTCAHLLAREGLSVGLLDAGRVGHGVSGLLDREGGRTAPARGIGDRAPATAPRRRAPTRRRTAGVEQIVAIAAELGIDCDLRRKPAFVWAESADEVADVESEAAAERDAGLPAELTVGHRPALGCAGGPAPATTRLSSIR